MMAMGHLTKKLLVLLIKVLQLEDLYDSDFRSRTGFDILYCSSSQNYEGVYCLENISVNGCTDEYAENYNADANVDDGSCTYPDTELFIEFYGVDDMIQIPDNDLYDFVNEFSIGFKFKLSLEFDGGWLATKGWDGHGQTN